MKHADWIWINKENNADEYAEFFSAFTYGGKGKVTLFLSCDGAYAALLNGKLVGFSGQADFPDYKFYDELDLTGSAKDENELKIVVWHFGTDSQTYISDAPGVIFEVENDGKTLAFSGENTLSRKMEEYRNGYKKIITVQLGFSFLFDATKTSGGYKKSELVNKTKDLHKRNIKPLVLKERKEIKIKESENSVIIDLGEEVAGFLDLDFTSPKKQKITVSYGEHLDDGCVRRLVGGRDFSAEYIAKKGRNEYLNPLRRIAGRYLEVFSESPLDIRYIGIRPVFYPTEKKNRGFQNPLLKNIYDVSVNTLRLCMHEHYEDCPWREQALYTMDSRNQMLCGYYAFVGGNAEFARHNLVLISKSLRSDGLLSICAPSGLDVPIPFFSLVYPVQVFEYIDHTGDGSILDEAGDVIRTIFKTFTEKIDKNGLIPTFPYPYWNFYEWAEYSDSATDLKRKPEDEYVLSYDLILNCMFVYACGYYEKLFGKKIPESEKVKRAIEKTLKTEDGFKLSTLVEENSALGLALAILIGSGDERTAEKMINDENVIKVTLSMKTFVYDALLTFGERYKDYIVKDIEKTYKKMLDKGATTFWETEKGSDDFDKAGSLCHGWSAIPVYYLSNLL